MILILAPLPTLSGDMCWLPPSTRHKLDIFRLWLRLHSLPVERITRKVYEWDMSNARLGKANWSRDLITLMTEIGCEHILENTYSDEHSKNAVLKEVQEHIKSNYILKWKDSVRKMPKLRMYVKLQSNWMLPDYVTLNMSLSARSALARFRNGTFPLAVETGRYIQKPLEQRVCCLCDKQTVENEQHFLLECDAYNEKRHVLFNSIFKMFNIDLRAMSKEQCLIHLLSSKNCAKMISKYIQDCFIIRNTR